MGINSNGGTQATIIDITPCNILTNIVYFKCHTPDTGTVLHRACWRENRYTNNLFCEKELWLNFSFNCLQFLSCAAVACPASGSCHCCSSSWSRAAVSSASRPSRLWLVLSETTQEIWIQHWRVSSHGADLECHKPNPLHRV